jgi:hypothetical protein
MIILLGFDLLIVINRTIENIEPNPIDAKANIYFYLYSSQLPPIIPNKYMNETTINIGLITSLVLSHASSSPGGIEIYLRKFKGRAINHVIF